MSLSTDPDELATLSPKQFAHRGGRIRTARLKREFTRRMTAARFL